VCGVAWSDSLAENGGATRAPAPLPNHVVDPHFPYSTYRGIGSPVGCTTGCWSVGKHAGAGAAAVPIIPPPRLASVTSALPSRCPRDPCHCSHGRSDQRSAPQPHHHRSSSQLSHRHFTCWAPGVELFCVRFCLCRSYRDGAATGDAVDREEHTRTGHAHARAQCQALVRKGDHSHTR
jgi:hypothetical protein